MYLLTVVEYMYLPKLHKFRKIHHVAWLHFSSRSAEARTHVHALFCERLYLTSQRGRTNIVSSYMDCAALDPDKERWVLELGKED